MHSYSGPRHTVIHLLTLAAHNNRPIWAPCYSILSMLEFDLRWRACAQKLFCSNKWFRLNLALDDVKRFCVYGLSLSCILYRPKCSFLPRCMECRRGLAMRILSVRLSVRPSVCLSVTRVYCDKTVERSVQIFIPYEKKI